jgi:hypothetical protein
MMTALLAARNILGEQHDVWAVNTDMEYQEEMKIHDPHPRTRDRLRAFVRRVKHSPAVPWVGTRFERD